MSSTELSASHCNDAARNYRTLKHEWQTWIVTFNDHMQKLREPASLSESGTDDLSSTAGVLENPFPPNFLRTLTSTIIPCISRFFRECKSVVKLEADKTSTSSSSLSSIGSTSNGPMGKYQRWSKSVVDGMISIVDMVHDIQQRRQFHLSNTAKEESASAENSSADSSSGSMLELWAPGEMEIWMMACQLIVELDTWMEQFDAGVPDSVVDEAERIGQMPSQGDSSVALDVRKSIAAQMPTFKQHRNRMFRVYSGAEQPVAPPADKKIGTTTGNELVASDSAETAENEVPNSQSKRNSALQTAKAKRMSRIPENMRKRWVISFIGEDESTMASIMDEIKLHMALSYHKVATPPSSAVPNMEVTVAECPAVVDEEAPAYRNMTADTLTPLRTVVSNPKMRSKLAMLDEDRSQEDFFESAAEAGRNRQRSMSQSVLCDKPLPKAPSATSRRASEDEDAPKQSFKGGLKKWLTAPTKMSAARKNIPTWMMKRGGSSNSSEEA